MASRAEIHTRQAARLFPRLSDDEAAVLGALDACRRAGRWTSKMDVARQLSADGSPMDSSAVSRIIDRFCGADNLILPIERRVPRQHAATGRTRKARVITYLISADGLNALRVHRALQAGDRDVTIIATTQDRQLARAGRMPRGGIDEEIAGHIYIDPSDSIEPRTHKTLRA